MDELVDLKQIVNTYFPRFKTRPNRYGLDGFDVIYDLEGNHSQFFPSRCKEEDLGNWTTKLDKEYTKFCELEDLSIKYPYIILSISPKTERSQKKYTIWVSRKGCGEYFGETNSVEDLEMFNNKAKLAIETDSYICSECGIIVTKEDVVKGPFVSMFCKTCSIKPNIKREIEASKKRGYYD